MQSLKKICVVTGSRAEYGHLFWLMHEIKSDSTLVLQLVVTGMHLEPHFGLTYREILKDGFKIAAKIPMNLSSDADVAITKSVGLAIRGFGRTFQRLKPDIVILLGDRFEILAASMAATLSRIPIAHLNGGELTEGSYDDRFRHAITKMAQWHFVSHEEYRRRVIQMGEDPRRVFNCGALVLDNLQRLTLLGKNQLEKDLRITIDQKTTLVTYHPATLEKGSTKEQIKNLFDAFRESGLKIIFTMPNADPENRIIAQAIRSFEKTYPLDVKVFVSLGQRRYLSLLRYIGLMIGNSSSGLIEAASFRLPVVNIGNRQKGRVRPKNVIDVDNDAKSIRSAIHKACSVRFRKSLSHLKNPFGDGRASPRIKNILKKYCLDGSIKKHFYDLK